METRRAMATLAASAVVLVAAGCGDHRPAPLPSTSDQLTLHGSVPNGELARPSFTLRDTSGRTYDFRGQTAGRITLLYAGYTHCPDECPTTMADIAVALRKVPRSVARQISVVFVTTDPWRDNTHVLRKWLDGFHPPTPYVGLTGTPARVAHVEQVLGMPPSKRQPAPRSYGSGAYSVSHFDGLLLYGRNDRLLTIYPSVITPTAIASDLRTLVGS